MKQTNKKLARAFSLLLIFLVSSLGAQVNLSSGLVAYYPLAGNANDASGNSNNGTPSGSAISVVDQWGNASAAYNFGGPNNAGKISVPNSASLQFSSKASFAFWMKLNSNVGTNGSGSIVAGGWQCPFAKEGDAGGGLYHLCALNGSTLNNSVGNVSMTTITAPLNPYATGQWVHCVYVMDTTEQRFYINGNLVSTVAGAPNFATMNTRQLVLGRFASNWYPLNGALDEFRVYNRALNTAEIAALAANNVIAISIDNMTPSTLCAGQNITVDFSVTGGTMSTGNVYTLQLSDAAGNFTYPVRIATLSSTALTGTFNATIPAGVPTGAGYRLRIAASAPASVSPSSAALTINGVLGDLVNLSQFRFIGGSSGNNYFVSTISQTWSQGMTTSQGSGGILASIPDAVTNTLIRDGLTVNTAPFIGFNDAASEGNFVWADGSPVTYTNWNVGEPNNSGNEDYATINSTTGNWNDVPGSISAPFVMQLRPATSNSPV